MGFTTTFLALGANSSRLERGEKVRIICKTRYKPRAVADNDTASDTESKKKAPKKKVTKKKAKVTCKKTTVTVRDTVEDLSDDDFDNAPIMPPPSTAQYPLMSAPKISARYSNRFGMDPMSHILTINRCALLWRQDPRKPCGGAGTTPERLACERLRQL